MNITQALKEKNKLTKLINECYFIACQNNSIEEGNVRKYSVKEQLEIADKLTTKLVELKTKIHRANVSVYDKIFRMAELKGRVTKIKVIPTDEGKINTSHWGSSSTPSVKIVEIDVLERAKIVSALEEEIEQLQNELDTHNALTNI